MDRVFSELGFLEIILDCLDWKDIGEIDSALTNHGLRPSFLLALRKFPRHQELDVLQSLDLMLWLKMRGFIALKGYLRLPTFVVQEGL